MVELVEAYVPAIGVLALVAVSMDIIKEFVNIPKQAYPLFIIALAVLFSWLMRLAGFATISVEEAFILALISSGAYGWGKAMLGKS